MRLDPDTGVADGEIQAPLAVGEGRPAQRHIHPARGREFDGIADQIEQNLAHTIRVPKELRRHAIGNRPVQHQVLRRRRPCQHGDDFPQNVGGAEWNQFELNPPLIDFRIVENFGQHFQQVRAGVLNDVGKPALFISHLGRAEKFVDAKDAV